MSTELAFLLLALIGACSVALMAAAQRAVPPDPYFDAEEDVWAYLESLPERHDRKRP